LGYNFSTSLLSKVRMNTGRVYLMGQNLLTLTNYSGMDPEVLGEGVTARGIDTNGRYPQIGMVGFGLNLDF
jgi:TonB-dependent starch-binding outer membrane protein SusC